MTTPIQSSKGIPPCQYTPYLDATLARIENAHRHRCRRRMMARTLVVCAVLAAVVLTAWIRANL